jgi:hypothetical protein
LQLILFNIFTYVSFSAVVIALKKEMDTYLFSFFLSGLFYWEAIPAKQPYKIIGVTSSYVILKGNKEGVFHLRMLHPHHSMMLSLSYFIENKSLQLYLVCPMSQRVDVLGLSTSYERSLKENGILLREYDLVKFISSWRDRIFHLPDSSIQCSEIINNTCDIMLRSASPPPYEDKAALSCVGVTPEITPFGIFQNEFSYSLLSFTKVNPEKLPKLKGNRTSIIFLPYGAKMIQASPILLDMSKKLEGVTPEPWAEDGRRINCVLLLDDQAPAKVDTRLLTPGNLERIKILHIRPAEYFQWIANSELKYNSLETSVLVREAVFKSTLDFRFTPPPFMYVWKVFAFHSHIQLNGTLPQSDWSSIVINQNALDYAKKCFSLETIIELRRSMLIRGTQKFEFMNSIERSIFKGAFDKKLAVKIYTCDPLHAFERQLEKVFKDNRPEDHFMSTMGYLRVKNGSTQKWSHEMFNLRIRKSGGFMYSDFIEECFSGFALESANKIVSSSPPDCCVCCSNPVNVLLETCGHSFCYVCLTTMLEHSTPGTPQMESCPTCRASFSKETMVQFRVYKTTRRKSKENNALTRRRALNLLLNPPNVSSRSSSSGEDAVQDMVMDNFFYDRTPAIETLLLVQYEEGIDKLRKWFPESHISCLENLQLSSDQPVSRIILVYPFMNLHHLAVLHKLLQHYTSKDFSLEILSLGFGPSCTYEDYSWVSSLAEDYGPHEKTISSLIL